MPTHVPRPPRHALVSRRLAMLRAGVPTALACAVAAFIPVHHGHGVLLGGLLPSLERVAGVGAHDARAAAPPQPRVVRHAERRVAHRRPERAAAPVAVRAAVAPAPAPAVRARTVSVALVSRRPVAAAHPRRRPERAPSARPAPRPAPTRTPTTTAAPAPAAAAAPAPAPVPGATAPAAAPVAPAQHDAREAPEARVPREAREPEPRDRPPARRAAGEPEDGGR